MKLSLSNDEAIVLFELLARFTEDEKLEILDESEAIVLWAIANSLETDLTEPFDSQWHEKLHAARRKVISRKS
ncbi:hypothetical protein ACPV5L_15360 [Vibrio astriarenae]